MQTAEGEWEQMSSVSDLCRKTSAVLTTTCVCVCLCFQKLLEAHEEQNSEAFTEAVSSDPVLL